MLGTFLSNIGTWIQRVAIGWLVFDMTGSAGWVGGVAMCEVLPSILVAPLAGNWADRTDRVRLFTGGQICALFQATTLALLAMNGLLSIPVFIAAALTLGVIDGVNQPTRLSLISDIARGGLVPAAVALNSLGFNAARFIGPAAGGFVLAIGGPALAFAANGLSFVPLILFLTVLRHRYPSIVIDTGGVRRDGILGGVRTAAVHPIIAPIFLMLIGSSVFARSTVDLLPAISGTWFDPTAETLASFGATVGIGAMCGAFWMVRRPNVGRMLDAAIWLPGCLAAVLLVFSATGGVRWAAHPLLFLMGFCTIGYGVGMQTVIQLTVDPAYRGRTLALYGITQRALPAIGAFGIGTVADQVGLHASLTAAGAIALLVWALVWRRRFAIKAALTAHGLPD